MTDQPVGSSEGPFHLPAFSGSFDRDSFTHSEDEDSSRHGSLSERRPSRLSQLLLMQEKKRKQKKYRDKQGFVWRRMIPDELPTFRVPNLTLPNHTQEHPQDQQDQKSPAGHENLDPPRGYHNQEPPGDQKNQECLGSQQNQGAQNLDCSGAHDNHTPLGGQQNQESNGSQNQNHNSLGGQQNQKDSVGSPCPEPHDNPVRTEISHPIQDSTESTSFRGGTNSINSVPTCDSTNNLEEPFQTPPLVRISNQLSQSPKDSFLLGDPDDGCEDSDSCSLKSENSFQTCSSEPQLHLVPKQVSENYKNSPSDREARKASFKTLQGLQANAQNNLLNSFDPGVGTKENKPQNIDIR